MYIHRHKGEKFVVNFLVGKGDEQLYGNSCINQMNKKIFPFKEAANICANSTGYYISVHFIAFLFLTGKTTLNFAPR